MVREERGAELIRRPALGLGLAWLGVRVGWFIVRSIHLRADAGAAEPCGVTPELCAGRVLDHVEVQ